MCPIHRIGCRLFYTAANSVHSPRDRCCPCRCESEGFAEACPGWRWRSRVFRGCRASAVPYFAAVSAGRVVRDLRHGGAECQGRLLAGSEKDVSMVMLPNIVHRPGLGSGRIRFQAFSRNKAKCRLPRARPVSLHLSTTPDLPQRMLCTSSLRF